MTDGGAIPENALRQVTNCTKANFIVAEDVPENQQNELARIFDQEANATFLRSTANGEYITAAQAFLIAVLQKGNLFDGLKPGDEPRGVRIKANYSADQDHYIVDTLHGTVRIREIHFEGDLSVM